MNSGHLVWVSAFRFERDRHDVRLGKRMVKRGQNKLDATSFSKLYDDYGAEVANAVLYSVNTGHVTTEEVERKIYENESKEDYSARLKAEWADEE